MQDYRYMVPSDGAGYREHSRVSAATDIEALEQFGQKLPPCNVGGKTVSVSMERMQVFQNGSWVWVV